MGLIMDDTLLFIPPCCVNKKLPQAIMQAPRRALTFYTHGDVSMEKMYRAVSYLITEPHVLVVTMTDLSMTTAAFFAQCFDREWITDLVLTTYTDVSAVIDKYLAEYRDHISYARSHSVSDLSSHMVLYTNNQAIIITGPMLEKPSTVTLVQYNMFYLPSFDPSAHGDWSNPLLNVLLPDVLAHRRTNTPVTPVLMRFHNYTFPPYKV